MNSKYTKRSCIKDSIKSIKNSIWSKDMFNNSMNYSPNDSIKKMPKYVAPISRSNKERWDVARLPTDVKAISKPSKRLDNFIREKDVNHYNAIEKLKENLLKVNYDFEESYRYDAELLKKFLNKEKEKVEEVIKETLLEPKTTILFAAIKYHALAKAICNYSCFCENAIEKFYDSALYLEKQRCDNYKRIYKSSYKEVCEISHLMPFQIQQYFEIEIVKFNEILLQNYRSYAEVNTILKYEIEQNKTIWHQKFNRNKVKWIDYFKSQGFNTNIFQKLSELEVKSIQSFISSAVSDKYKDVLATVTELDELVNEALRKCKFALLKIYYGEYNELHMLDDSFLIPTDNASQDQLLQFKTELRDIMQRCEEEHLLENGLDDDTFKMTVMNLKERIDQTDIFFARVSHLWDGHFRRDSALSNTVTNHIKKIMADHDTMIQSIEVQLSIYIDNCRSAGTVEEMQLNFGYAVASLKKCADMFSGQMLSEQEVLNKYLEMVDIEGDILVAEMGRFLIVYEPTYDFPLPKATRQSTDDLRVEVNTDDIFLNQIISGKEDSIPSTESSCIMQYLGSGSIENRPPHIKYVDYRITSLDNWKYGIWETIESKMRDCKEEMLEKALQWTEPYKNAIDLRCKQKMAMNQIKFYRIWLTVYYMRFIEIQHHNDRLERHSKGINKVNEDVTQIQNNTLKEISLLVDVTAEKVRNLEKDVKNAKSTAYLQSANVKMKVIKENFQKDLDKSVEIFKSEKLKHESFVQISNIEYLKNILMFSESGNFHVDEVKLLCDELQNREKEFLKKTDSRQKEFLLQIPKMSQKVNILEASFKNLSNYMQDEFTFIDNIRDCMNTLQNEIKSTAYNLKYKRKSVEAYVEKVKEMAGKLKGSSLKEDVEYFAAKCNEVIRNFEDLYLLLTRNDEIDILPDINKNSKQRRSKTSTTKSASKMGEKDKRSSFKSASKTVSVRGDNAMLVSYKSPRSQEAFSTTKVEIITPFNDCIVNILTEKLEQMRSFGLSFYTTVKSIENKDKIEATFEEYCANLIAKGGYFQIQCDAMWLEEAIEYTKLVALFRNGLLKTYQDFLKHSLENNQMKFEKRFANLQEILNKIAADGTSEIKKVHKRLKTLHGHPKNKVLLETLYSEFEQELDRYNSNIFNNIGNFKVEHITLKELIMTKLTAFKDILQELLLSEGLKNLNGDIFVQILNLFIKLQNLKVKKSDITLTAGQEKDMIISTMANEQFSGYKSSLVVIPIPEEFITRFSVSNKSQSTESMSGTFEFDDNVYEAIDLAAYSKKMDYILDNHLEGVNAYEIKVGEECSAWDAIWKNDVHIIENLYTVKYKIPTTEISEQLPDK